MAHVIIDRRKNDKGKSTDNRRRFVKRVKDQVREAIKDVISNGTITDIISDKSKRIIIPGRGLNKPTFGHSDDGGVRDIVRPGNEEFEQGDRFGRPRTGRGKAGGRNASNEGESENDFYFSLSSEEYLEFFFQDLELPDLVQKQITKIEEFVIKRAGFSVDGPPSRLNVVRSMKLSKGRRFALRTPKKKELKKLEEQLTLLVDIRTQVQSDYKLFLQQPSADGGLEYTNKLEELDKQICELEEQMDILTRKIKAIPFIDDVDLRYNRWEKFPNPTTQAVIFAVMDVSGSMGEWETEMAKRFFMLLLVFLKYNYEKVDIVWIRHHTIASEVDEDEFFHSRDSGGTLVSPALELVNTAIQKRYPPSLWNVFCCQISDGDNWSEDTNKAIKILDESILKLATYMAYIEIKQDRGRPSELWPHYEKLKETNKNMAMQVVTGPEEIYPVFRTLFEKRK